MHTPLPKHAWLRVLHRAFISWAFARFYHEFAWTYDIVAWLVSRGLWYRWTLAALPYVRGSVLEVGCGTGFMQCALAARYDGCVVGLDESAQMLGLTQRRARRTGQQVRLLRGSAQVLPLASGSVRSVLATFPSDYIVQPATLAEIRRVLSADGRLVVVDAPHFAMPGMYEQVVNLLYRLTFLKPLVPGSRQPNVGQQTVVSDADFPYRPIFERAGFAVQVFCEQVGPSQIHIFVAQPDQP